MESLPLAPPSTTESNHPEDCPTSVLPVNQVYTFLKENEKKMCIYMTQILTRALHKVTNNNNSTLFK